MRILSKTAINDIASGNADLTKRLDLKHTKKEVASIVDGFNKFVEKLHEIVSSIKNTELQLSSVDENLQTSTNETITDISDILNNINSFYIGP